MQGSTSQRTPPKATSMCTGLEEEQDVPPTKTAPAMCATGEACSSAKPKTELLSFLKTSYSYFGMKLCFLFLNCVLVCICRQMLFCRVTLGKSFLQFSAMKMAHAPPGHHSVIGRPSVNGLAYAEYVIYRGEQVSAHKHLHSSRMFQEVVFFFVINYCLFT